MFMLPEFLTNLAAGLDISNLPGAGDPDPGNSTLQNIFNLVLVICGALAVLMVVISGFRFITSRGNPAETAKARNGIIYSLIGLMVVMFAFSIVNFVVFRVT
jgi:cytochrome bd-type quinol oxidase subunit 2